MSPEAAEAGGTPAATPTEAADTGGKPVDIATQSLARPAAVMAVGTALSRLTGLGRVVAMAFALGVAESRLADAYNLANTLPLVLYELVLGGILTSVFIPVLVEELRTKPRDEAWRSISGLVTTAVLMLCFLTVVTLAIAPVVIDLFTGRVPDADAATQRDLATFFLRVFAPQIALFGASALAAGLLNAHGRFAVPTFAPIVNNLILIATFLIFAAVTTGVTSSAEAEADLGLKLLLGAGATAAVACMAAINWAYVLRLPGKLRPRLDLRNPVLRKLARLSAWTIAYVITNTAGLAVSFYLANGVQGGLTAYVTAFAFFQLPIGIAATSIVTALVPQLSAHHIDGREEAFRARLAGGAQTLTFLMLPATAAFVVLAEPLIRVLLEHGIVSTKSTELVASLLRLFAVGLLPFAVYQLLMRAYYTRQDAKTPALINVWENLATIVFDIVLFAWISVKGLALAHSLGYVVGCLVGIVLLVRRLGPIAGRQNWIEMGKALIASALCAAAMVVVLLGVAELIGPGELRALVQLVAGGLAGGAVFFVAAKLMGARDLEALARLVPARFRSKLT
jgi:putative peptidoglycan lipid II flippase